MQLKLASSLPEEVEFSHCYHQYQDFVRLPPGKGGPACSIKKSHHCQFK